MPNPSFPNRRDFLKTSGIIATGTALAGGLGVGRSAHAAGSDLIKIGLVGCGGRGRGAAMNALMNIGHPNVKIIAIADAFPQSVDATFKMFEANIPDKADLPEERRFSGLDCCDKLLQTDVDVVLLCEPPGFRPRHFKAAVDAGKHVFAEKPVATDAPGVRMFREAAKKAEANKQAVIVGHHLRYEDKHIESIKRIHAGEIGELQFIRAYFNTGYLWSRPRREGQTEMEHQVSNWYYFNWLSGDHIVEQHVHDIDVMNWIAGDILPVEATGMGGRQVRIDKNFGEIFDHHAVEYTYANGVKGFSYCRQINGCWDSFSEHAHCSQGHVNMEGHGTVTMYPKGKDPIKWTRDKDGHETEMDFLFGSLAKGEAPNTGVRAADATLTAILGRMATYCGQTVTWEQANNSELDIFPKSIAWDADPGSKPNENGIYPCAMPGITKSW